MLLLSLIAKEISMEEHECMNMHLRQINVLVIALSLHEAQNIANVCTTYKTFLANAY